MRLLIFILFRIVCDVSHIKLGYIACVVAIGVITTSRPCVLLEWIKWHYQISDDLWIDAIFVMILVIFGLFLF
jgi:hypothetical protein